MSANFWLCVLMIFSKLHILEHSSRRRTLSRGGEQYGGQGYIVVAAIGFPKLKSSGLNLEPTKKKGSRLGTWLGVFSSSWYLLKVTVFRLLGSTRTSGLRFLVEPGISCLLQELFLFLTRKFFGDGSIFYYYR